MNFGDGGGGGGGGEDYKELGIIKFNQDFIRTERLSGVNKHPGFPASGFKPSSLITATGAAEIGGCRERGDAEQGEVPVDHTGLWNAGRGIIGAGCLCIITRWSIYTRTAYEGAGAGRRGGFCSSILLPPCSASQFWSVFSSAVQKMESRNLGTGL